jgi:hypothetical protein
MLHQTIVISKGAGSGDQAATGQQISRNGDEIVKVRNLTTGAVEYIKASELSPFEHKLLLVVDANGAENEFIISDITMRP